MVNDSSAEARALHATFVRAAQLSRWFCQGGGKTALARLVKASFSWCPSCWAGCSRHRASCCVLPACDRMASLLHHALINLLKILVQPSDAHTPKQLSAGSPAPIRG